MFNLASLTLTQMLVEMDQALADEIDKQSRRKQTKHIASDGKLLSEENGHYTYQFSLSDPWDPQDDTPLVVLNAIARGIRCTVINSIGTIITLAADQLLPPDLLHKIELNDDSTELLKRQREALKEVNEGEAQMGSKTFGLVPYHEESQPVNKKIGFRELRDQQQRAVQKSLGGEVAFIVGPPGTGKTFTLAAIAFHHLEAGRTVLIAAHTNIAIDNAMMTLCQMCKDMGRTDLLARGLVVRYGAVQKEELKKNDFYAEVYLPKLAKRLGGELYAQREQAMRERDRIVLELATFQQHQQANETERQREQADLRALLKRLQQAQAPLKLEEQHYIAKLQAQRDQYSDSLAELDREIAFLSSQLARKKALIEEQKLVLAREQMQEQQFLAQLVEARTLNGIKRFFKGIHLDALEISLAQCSQTIYEIQQSLNVLLSELEPIHQMLATSSQKKKINQQIFNKISLQLTQPSERSREIEQLQVQMLPIQQRLREIDTLWEQEKRQFHQAIHSLVTQQASLEELLDKLDQQLRDIEKSIVAQASIIGTTLTKTYMNQTVSARRFDAVILDEVSMASMPLIYIATAHAKRLVTLIGDPQQLAPILSAETAMAKKWLGDDLFTYREISLLSAIKGFRHSAILDVQSRMHPDIAKIANTVVYDSILKNAFVETKQQIAPLPEAALILCDTHDASPIVSRPANGHSRLNYYHALCCLALARKALASLSPNGEGQAGPRIGIVTPYRSQAQLVQKMVVDAGLKAEIQAGTVHRFQGLEFDVVIFDTVESPGLEPGEFISGSRGSDSMRLINVAVTRARLKLFVVANWSHLQQKLSERSTLRESVAIASRSARFASLDIVGTSFASVVDEANKQKSILSKQISRQQPLGMSDQLSSLLQHPSVVEEGFLVLGPAKKARERAIFPSSAVPSSKGEQSIEHFTEVSFYDVFKHDFRCARTSSVIASPFISRNRLNDLLPLLLEQQKKGLRMTILTRSLAEKKDDVWDMEGTQTLMDAGFKLTFRANMHEKIVIIDDAILYHGSLNILSHNNTSESMLRVTNKEAIKAAGEALHTVRISNQKMSSTEMQNLKTLTISIRELPSVLSTCNICGDVLVPQKRNDGSSAFYTCPNYKSPGKHSTKSILTAHLEHILQLQQQKCFRCGNILTVHVKEEWPNHVLLKCSDTHCDEVQKVVFTK